MNVFIIRIFEINIDLKILIFISASFILNIYRLSFILTVCRGRETEQVIAVLIYRLELVVVWLRCVNVLHTWIIHYHVWASWFLLLISNYYILNSIYLRIFNHAFIIYLVQFSILYLIPKCSIIFMVCTLRSLDFVQLNLLLLVYVIL